MAVTVVGSFGGRLRRAREVAGLTQPQLAIALGFKTKRGGITISEWENDKVESLKAANLQTLSSVLGVSVDWLLHGPRVATEAPRVGAEEVEDLVEDVPTASIKKKRGGRG